MLCCANNSSHMHKDTYYVYKKIVEAGGCLVVVAQWSEHWWLMFQAQDLISGNSQLFTLIPLFLHRISKYVYIPSEVSSIVKRMIMLKNVQA